MDYSFNKIKGIEYTSSFRFVPGQLILDKFMNLFLVLKVDEEKSRIMKTKVLHVGNITTLNGTPDGKGDREIFLRDAYIRIQGKFWKVLDGNILHVGQDLK